MSADSARAPAPNRRGIWIGPLLLSGLYLALTVWTWRKWGDIRIDHGQQLYLPWQIVEGRDLYRDLAWVYGPFSQYFNALLFRIFGVSYTTLIFADLAILALLCVLLYRLLGRLCDRYTATLAVGAFLTVFAFGHLVVLGNYNFVAPYAHEATHGTVLCFAMLAGLMRHTRTGSAASAFGVGVAAGLCLLTKPEVTVAAIGALVWWGGFTRWLRGTGRDVHATSPAPVALGIAAAVAFAYAVLALRTSPADGLVALTHAWQPLAGSDVAGAYYFQAGLGLDAPWANLAALVGAGLVIAAGVAIVSVLDARGFAPRERASWREALAAGAIGLALWIAFPDGPWKTLGRALPLLALSAFAIFVRCAWRAGDAEELRRFVALSSLCVLALGLASKMALNPRLHHYGFFLAMPSTLVGIAVIAWWLPAELARRRRRGSLVRLAAAACVLAGAVAHLHHSAPFYARKEFAFGRGGDTILTAPGGRRGGYGKVMQQTLEMVESHVARDESLLALPYGIMFNYQSRRPNPSPYMRWTALEFVTWNEARMIDSLVAAPPDWVLLVHSASQAEFRLGRFGEDPRNGRALLAWINANYRAVQRVGAEPFRTRYFGAKLMRRGRN